MSLQEINKSIGGFFEEWKSLQPLKPEYKERLNKKIRLEWNYNSNHIEGNTLTYGETAALILEGKEEGIHPKRDYMEMKAHDLAIEKVREFAADKDRKLTESDIRGLNKLILKEPFWAEAITAEGQKTQKEIIPGIYKTQPNHVRMETGKIFKFAEPHDVPAKMKELVEWFDREMQDPPLAVSSFLTELHHRFILIHPFDDGNGRIVRLWMNYVLLRLGYPPLVIKSEDKKNYFAALQKADGGDMDILAVYLGNVLIDWLDIGIKAAKGENIKDVTDVDKEWSIFVASEKNKGLKNTGDFISSSNVEQICEEYLTPFLKNFEKEFRQFYEVFAERKIHVLSSPCYEEEKEQINPQSFRKIHNNMFFPSISNSLLNSLFNAPLDTFIIVSEDRKETGWEKTFKNFMVGTNWSRKKERIIRLKLLCNGYMGECHKVFDIDSALFIETSDFEYRTWIEICNKRAIKTIKKQQIKRQRYILIHGQKKKWTNLYSKQKKILMKLLRNLLRTKGKNKKGKNETANLQIIR